MCTIVHIPNEGTTLADRIADTRTLPANGEIGNGRSSCYKNENVTPTPDRGTSSAYRLGKIKRDHPELAER